MTAHNPYDPLNVYGGDSTPLRRRSMRADGTPEPDRATPSDAKRGSGDGGRMRDNVHRILDRLGPARGS